MTEGMLALKKVKEKVKEKIKREKREDRIKE